MNNRPMEGAASTAPVIPPVQRGAIGDPLSHLPEAMRHAPRWLVWKSIANGEKKPRKVPFYANGAPRQGQLDTPEDRARLATLDEALVVLETGEYAGLGFALGPDEDGHHWQGIDLDGTDTRPDLAALVERLPGYVERSPSGTGWHAIGIGRDFATLGNNGTGIEAYAHGRYFTVTSTDGRGDLEDIADFVTVTLSPLHARAKAKAAPIERPHVDTTDQLVRDLRSALASMRSDDRDLWVRMGLALKPLGDQGRALWLEWSQTSEKFDPKDAARTWDSFKPEGTGPKAVFAEAQRSGWVNPAKRERQPAEPRKQEDARAQRPEPPPADVHGEPDDWPTPGDLSAPIDGEPYPLAAFPQAAQNAIREYAAFGQQPLPLIGSSALAQMALAAQGLANVGINDHLVSPISLYLLLCAVSGERKSAADKFFGRAIKAWVRETREKRLPDHRRSVAMAAAHKSRVEGTKSKIKAMEGKDDPESEKELERLEARLVELEQNPIVPIPLPSPSYEDVNPASLAYALATGWPSGGLFSDEAGTVVGSQGLGDDSATSLLALLNILWDARDFLPTRKGAPVAELRGRRFSAFLMMQPDLLPRLIDKGARTIGFLARFLLAAPRSTMGTRAYAEPPASWRALEDFERHILDLLALPLPIDDTGEDKGARMMLKPPVMRLSAGAKLAWITYHDTIERELADFGEFAEVRDVAAKSAENAARVATIFQLFDHGRVTREIEEHYMAGGIAVAAWHLAEARRIFYEADTPEVVLDARELSAWLTGKGRELANRDGEPIIDQAGLVSLRDVSKFGPNRTRDALKRDAAIDLLEESGHVRRIDRGRQRLLQINPRLLVSGG
ncbi:DUF3987 domain-containing protein [Allochromatium humboldtianum]|uniref:DUF3987 domain-containing protein n=2 Tax=Allochromatium humboldtianum TaxID=504901 RepID=A0A850RNZ2_9GAMM|nr:DUF3987 domain-containing protein [Allochromatium humboldtianum]